MCFAPHPQAAESTPHPSEALRDMGADARRLMLEAVVAAGRARWPAWRFDGGALLEALDRHVEPERDRIDPTYAADLCLVGLCLMGHDRACAVFVVEYLGPLRRLVDRILMHGDEGGDLLQELAPRFLVAGRDGRRPWLSGYTGRGALGVWLRLIVVRRALNLARDRDISVELLTLGDPSTEDAELAFIRRRHCGDIQATFREAIARTPPGEQRLLRLHYVERTTLDGLAAMFGTSRSGIHRRLDEARRALHRRMVAGLHARVRANEDERQSLLLHFRSELGDALAGLLA